MNDTAPPSNDSAGNDEYRDNVQPKGCRAWLIGKYRGTRGYLKGTKFGYGLRRAHEVDLMNQAMILAAFAFMTMIPLMITLTAISPIGNANSLSSNIMSRLGLSEDAETDIRALFAGPQLVRDAVTAVSVLLLVINAVSFPFALQRTYEHIWRVPSLGMRGWWRALVWLLGFVVYVGFLAYVAPLNTRSTPRTLVSVMISLLATTAGAWVTQYLLLGGRLRWWPLLPGAVATGVGLVILRSASALYPSKSIVASSAQYGPIGVVFVLLTWAIVVSWVILSAAVVGAVLYEHPLHFSRSR